MSFQKIKRIIKIEEYNIPNSDIADIDGKLKYKMSDNYELPQIGSTNITTTNLGKLENGKDLYEESKLERLILGDQDTIRKMFIYYYYDCVPIEKKKKSKKPKNNQDN